MKRILRQRLEKSEELSARLRLKPSVGHRRVLNHATAVAAIVLSGQPRVDEPLHRAWARALQHYGIDVGNDQIAAVKRLDPIIMEGKEKSARFTEIFRTAPVWLLQFTGMSMDAHLLGFDLPDISERLRWGSEGYEDARKWPLLPSGTVTAGDSIPDSDERQLWLISFCEMAHQVPKISSHREDEDDHSFHDDPLWRDIFFALELDQKPEQEWSRYEKRRMRKLSERISRL